jgi:hypothetical protein
MAQYEVAKDEHISDFVNGLIAQWPRANITAPTSADHGKYICVDEALESARARFQSWHRNGLFREYVIEAQDILNGLRPADQNLQRYYFSSSSDEFDAEQKICINFDDLTSNPTPCLPDADLGDFDGWINQSGRGETDHAKLEQLLRSVSLQCSSEHEKQYSEDLHKSFEALRDEDTSVELKPAQELFLPLELYLERTRDRAETIYQMICRELQAIPFELSRETQMLPRLSPASILSHLASDKI